jgi:hypothetical protein
MVPISGISDIKPSFDSWSLLLTFPQPALLAKIRSDAAEDEDFGDSKARTTTKYERIFAATRRAGANFPDFRVARCSETTRYPSLLAP